MSETKQCITCGETKPVERFHWRNDMQTYVGECKDCRAARGARRYRENTERHAAQVKARYEIYGRFHRYGISAERYERALVEQDGKCKLCGASEPGGKGKWHIDHSHPPRQPNGYPRKTKKVLGFNQNDDPTKFRGLLCHACNISLGHYENLVAQVGEDRLMRYLHPERYEMPRSASDAVRLINRSIIPRW